MRVEDAAGHPWDVLPGDPARPLVNRLVSLNYDYIVLTVPLLCGIMREPSEQETPNVVTPDDDQAPPPETLVRRVRLADCIAALKREGLIA